MTPPTDEARATECVWCGAPLVNEGGVWTDKTYGSGDYCPEGKAVGRDGTSPHKVTDEARAGEPWTEVPRTEAGRTMGEFLAALIGVEQVDPRHIVAIEREAADAPALDVERLAAAAQNHETSGIHGSLHCSLACGASLAAEYGRLSESAPPVSPLGETDPE